MRLLIVYVLLVVSGVTVRIGFYLDTACHLSVSQLRWECSLVCSGDVADRSLRTSDGLQNQPERRASAIPTTSPRGEGEASKAVKYVSFRP